MPLRLLVLTNLFPSAWDPRRSPFNRQQFERLAQREGIEVDVMTAVDWRQRLAGGHADVTLNHVRAHHFTFVYPPRFGRRLHAHFWLASLLAQQARFLRRNHFDCLLASWAYPDGVAVARLARRMQLPYAIKVHGSDLNVLAEVPAQRRQISAALAGASAVIAVSRALADKAIALGADPVRVHVLYNGVDSERFQPGSRSAARERLAIEDGAELILYVGNLKLSKGCMDLLDALPAVFASRPQAQAVLIGAGPDRSALAQRVESLGLGARVRMPGSVAHEGLRDWFQASNLLCLPSHNEGVPNVVLEAMACGMPVVATSVGGIPEILPDFAGRLVKVGECERLQLALTEVLAHSWDTARIVEHAGTFRWRDNVDQLFATLTKVASTRFNQSPTS